MIRTAADVGRTYRRHRVVRAASSGVVVVLLGFAASGCGLFGSDAETPPPSTTTTSSTTTSTTAPPVAESAPPTVLDAGAEPRRQLRLQFTEDQEATVSFTSDISIEQGNGGRDQGIDSPPITQELHYRVGEVTTKGAEVSVRITALTVERKGTNLSDEAAERLEAELEPMVGALGKGFVTTLGEWEDVSFDLPAAATDAVRAQVEALDAQLGSLGPSLPAEAVGVGARWTTTSSTGDAETETETETTGTYTVTALTEDEVEYTATIATTARPHELAPTGLPKGTTATLQSSELTGTTTGSLALDRPGFTLRTRIAGPQTIVLTGPDGDTTLSQQVELAYRAETDAG